MITSIVCFFVGAFCGFCIAGLVAGTRETKDIDAAFKRGRDMGNAFAIQQNAVIENQRKSLQVARDRIVDLTGRLSYACSIRAALNVITAAQREPIELIKPKPSADKADAGAADAQT